MQRRTAASPRPASRKSARGTAALSALLRGDAPEGCLLLSRVRSRPAPPARGFRRTVTSLERSSHPSRSLLVYVSPVESDQLQGRIRVLPLVSAPAHSHSLRATQHPRRVAAKSRTELEWNRSLSPPEKLVRLLPRRAGTGTVPHTIDPWGHHSPCVPRRATLSGGRFTSAPERVESASRSSAPSPVPRCGRGGRPLHFASALGFA